MEGGPPKKRIEAALCKTIAKYNMGFFFFNEKKCKAPFTYAASLFTDSGPNCLNRNQRPTGPFLNADHSHPRAA